MRLFARQEVAKGRMVIFSAGKNPSCRGLSQAKQARYGTLRATIDSEIRANVSVSKDETTSVARGKRGGALIRLAIGRIAARGTGEIR